MYCTFQCPLLHSLRHYLRLDVHTKGFLRLEPESDGNRASGAILFRFGTNTQRQLWHKDGKWEWARARDDQSCMEGHISPKGDDLIYISCTPSPHLCFWKTIPLNSGVWAQDYIASNVSSWPFPSVPVWGWCSGLLISDKFFTVGDQFLASPTMCL